MNRRLWILVDVPVCPHDIQAAHRIDNDKQQTIVHFVNRKDAAIANRPTLKDFDVTSVGLDIASVPKFILKNFFVPFSLKCAGN